MEEANELIKILENQLKLYEKLCELCKQEKEVIVEGDLKGLEEIVQKEEEVFTQMRIWEKLRLKVLTSLKEKFSLPEKTTFSEVIEKLRDFPSFPKLNSLREKIISKIKEISQINRENISLLEYSVRLIDECFSKLTKIRNNSIYTPSGKTQIREQTQKLLNETG